MKLESYKVNRVLEPNFKKSEQVQKGLKKSKIEILWVLWKMQSIGIYLFFEHDSSNGLLEFLLFIFEKQGNLNKWKM